MGGYDIFVSQKAKGSSLWSKPENFGYPINDTYDNETISILENKRYGYISAIRNTGFGDKDIYKVVFNQFVPDYIIFTGKISVAGAEEGKTLPLHEVDDDITITIYNLKNKEVYGIYAYNKKTGKFVISLTPGVYGLVIEGKSYEKYKKKLVIKEQLRDEKLLNMNIYLQKKSE